MNPKAEDLKRRAHAFFMRVIDFCRGVPSSIEGDSITSQLVDAAGSTESNYRAACKARSRREFVAKIGVAAEEADESLGWLRSCHDANLGDNTALPALIKEANELTAIFVASHKTASSRLEAEKKRESDVKRRKRRRK